MGSFVSWTKMNYYGIGQDKNLMVSKGDFMDIDISKEIQRITDQIIQKYKPDKIILFGSAARNDMEPDSDADFLIIKKDSPLYGADRIRELSRMIDRNIPVDFLVYRPDEFDQRIQMEDPFLKAILKEGRVLYG
jgi:predicted nucleotidyltransferase